MAGWLSRTTSLFQKPPPPLPEPFEVECDCGGKVVGKRAGNYQKPTCPNCSRPVFVLPLNVYPRPVTKSPPKSTSPKKGGESRGAQPSANTAVQDIPALNPTKSASGKKTDPGRATPATVSAEPELLREPRPPLVTPLRLVAAAIIIVSLFTIRGLVNRQRIETAKATVAASADKGMAAIKEGDFATAAKELEKLEAKTKTKTKKIISSNINSENVILEPSVICNQIDGCIQILKSGPNKGNICGCKISYPLEKMCKRHYLQNHKN